MIVYDGVKTDFLACCENDTIAAEIEKNVLEKLGRHTAKPEIRAWENSLNYMYKVLNDAAIPSDAGVAIEFNIPQTAKRIDFMISGYGADDKAGVVIVELKQWESLKAVEGQEALVETYIGGGQHKLVLPSYQAWSYAQLIRDYNQNVQDGEIELTPCACLHNYVRRANDPVDAPQYAEFLEEAPVYTKGEISKLRDFIKASIRKGDGKQTLYRIERGKIRPSKSLQDAIGSMLKGNREFTMIDEQKVAYEEILSVSAQCQRDSRKRTVIVRGGPGTGKSVIAVNLLAALTARGQMVQYVSKNSAPRQVYLKKLKGQIRKSSVDNMFKGSGAYVYAGADVAGTLLVDEAHRLNEKSGMFRNLGENQIKEIVHAARCSVFFIDESQRVTIDDIGSEAEIEKWAKAEGSELSFLELKSQFRCNGSDGYLAWVDDVLGIRETANRDLDGIDYDIRICSTPQEMRDLVVERNHVANRSRILAGYCWDWNKKEMNNTDWHDVRIGDFGMSWNLGNGEPFAVGETSINEVGCIHTAQGLEFDYVGVIIGDDMRFENGRVVTDFTKRAKTDQSLKGIKMMHKENPAQALKTADEIIRNTYRTLMTRGMKGCYVYCTNEPLAAYLRSCLGK